MRNLKKILALVLALVMSMSLVVTANAFSDDDAIAETYREAATVLDGLKVLQGRDDGNFDPKASITRAEMAAIVYRIMTTDVEDKQTSIYAESSKLSDVNSTSWYAGYVGYCNNSNYIKGYDDGTFKPLKNVTGHEALAMLLRGMGYGKNGEFEGRNWAVNTAARANALGLTKNINEGMLSQPATREMVAEMAFRAMLAPTTSWSLGLDYQPTGKTLGDAFKLHAFEGVVTANEYADLYSARPMAEGKTEIGDETYTYASTLEDIGEARCGYAAFNNNTVLYIADAGNTVYENAGAAVKNAAKAAAAEGIEIAKATEKYINFGGDGDVFESDYRIEFEVTFANAAAAEDFAENYIEVVDYTDATVVYPATYNKVVRANTYMTSADLAVIRGIFAAADDDDASAGISGNVYVGSNSQDKEKDVSDTMSYKKFYNEYIVEVSDFADVNSADNGEWLKVIDNNGDGVAEYVLRTDFVMTTIVDYDKRNDVYTVEYNNTEIDGYAISTEIEELSEDDVILYTKIDGVYYITYPQVDVKSVAKKGIDYKNHTITTTDDAVYGQSGIEEKAVYFANDITDAETEVSYDLYLDHFGYVRLYTESAYNKGIALLLDGYYKTDRRDDEFKAQIWDTEAQDDVDVNVLNTIANPATAFIDTTEGGDNGNRGTWKRLDPVDAVYNDFTWDNAGKYITNVAAFTVNDEDAYTLSLVDADKAVTNKNRTWDVVELDLNATDDVEERTYASEEAKGTENFVQTSNDTLYYFVTVSNGSVKEVISWVGYTNAPKEAILAKDAVAYAVTTDGTGRYDKAEIVVFESKAVSASDLYLVYGLNGKTAATSDAAFAAGYNPETEAYENDLRKDIKKGSFMDPRGAFYGLPEFYTIYEDGTVEPVDYTDCNIYAGEARVNADINKRDYQIVDTDKHGSFEFVTTGVPTFIFTYNDKADNQIRYEHGMDDQYEDFREDDQIIVVTNSKGAVLYTVNVTQSVWGNKGQYPITAANDLYNAILTDNNAVESTGVRFYGVIDNEIELDGITLVDQAPAAGTIKVTYAQAKAALAAGDAALTVNGAEKCVIKKAGVEIKASDIKLETKGATYTLSVLGKDGSISSYTLIQDAGTPGATLVPDAATTATIAGKVITVGTLGSKMTIAQFKNSFTTTPANLDVVWTFYDGVGVITDESKLMNTVASFIAVVYAEDGTPVEYTMASPAYPVTKTLTLGTGVSAKYQDGTPITTGTSVVPGQVLTFTASNNGHFVEVIDGVEKNIGGTFAAGTTTLANYIMPSSNVTIKFVRDLTADELKVEAAVNALKDYEPVITSTDENKATAAAITTLVQTKAGNDVVVTLNSATKLLNTTAEGTRGTATADYTYEIKAGTATDYVTLPSVTFNHLFDEATVQANLNGKFTTGPSVTGSPTPEGWANALRDYIPTQVFDASTNQNVTVKDVTLSCNDAKGWVAGSSWKMTWSINYAGMVYSGSVDVTLQA